MCLVIFIIRHVATFHNDYYIGKYPRPVASK